MPLQEEPPPVPRAVRARRGALSPAERADRLTAREVEVLQLTLDGLGMDQIARQLEISPHTIRTHMQNCLTKLGVHSKLEAITFALRTGVVRLDAIPGNGGPEAPG